MAVNFICGLHAPHSCHCFLSVLQYCVFPFSLNTFCRHWLAPLIASYFTGRWLLSLACDFPPTTPLFPHFFRPAARPRTHLVVTASKVIHVSINLRLFHNANVFFIGVVGPDSCGLIWWTIRYRNHKVQTKTFASCCCYLLLNSCSCRQSGGLKLHEEHYISTDFPDESTACSFRDVHTEKYTTSYPRKVTSLLTLLCECKFLQALAKIIQLRDPYLEQTSCWVESGRAFDNQ
jgi:hypothetical protein